MINGFVKFALEVAQMPAATIAELDASLPGFALMAADIKALEPDIASLEPHIAALMDIYNNQAKQHVDAVWPLIMRMWPTVRLIYPLFVANLPTAEDLIDFARSKSSS